MARIPFQKAAGVVSVARRAGMTAVEVEVLSQTEGLAVDVVNFIRPLTGGDVTVFTSVALQSDAVMEEWDPDVERAFLGALEGAGITEAMVDRIIGNDSIIREMLALVRGWSGNTLLAPEANRAETVQRMLVAAAADIGQEQERIGSSSGPFTNDCYVREREFNGHRCVVIGTLIRPASDNAKALWSWKVAVLMPGRELANLPVQEPAKA